MIELIALGLIFGVAIIAPFLVKKLPNTGGYWLAAIPGLLFLYFLFQVESIFEREVTRYSINWIPELDINLSIYMDGLSLLFALLVSGIGALVFIFAGYYMRSYHNKPRFFLYLMLFFGAMLGIVLSGNLMVLFVFWELTSISSFLLIGFYNDKQASRTAALQAMLITVFGGLMLMASLVLLHQVTGTFEINEILKQGDLIRSHDLYIPILILLIIGAFTKSAQFPFHFWLPGAMQAPAPVSAFLHSATMVKAGIFILARLSPALGYTPQWNYILTLTGAITMLVGAYLALGHTDLKKILAYTTISALGTLVMLLGIGTALAAKAAMLFLVVHSLYKGTLFMIAGAIEKKTGTRDIMELGKLFFKMPVLSIAAIMALLSMAGLPPFLGFIGKEIIYEAKIQAPGIANYVLVIAIAANIMMVAISVLVAWEVFFAPPGNKNLDIKRPTWGLLAGPVVLAVSSLLMGMFPKLLAEPFILPAIEGLKAHTIDLKIKLWHGFNLVFLLSVITVVSGVILFFLRKRLVPFLVRTNNSLFKIELAHVFNRRMDNFIAFTVNHTRTIQHGYHRFYLMLIFVVTSVLVWVKLIMTQGWEIGLAIKGVPFYALGITILLVLGALISVFSRSRLVAIVSLGVVGYSLALIFLFYGAIDVAITLLLVETLTLILFVIVIYHLPRYMHFSSNRSRIRDGVIALLFGSFMTALVLKAGFINLSPPISDFFLEKSYTEGFGKNIVNVILVDFRVLDTFGEITVLMIAAVGVYALLKYDAQKRL